jgi:hypothetical protein
MITDAQLRPSNAQDLATPAAGTITSTNVIDTLDENNNLGRGSPLRGVVTLDTAMAGGTSLNVLYVQSANPDLSSSDTLAQSGVIVTASLPDVGEAPVWDFAIPDNTKRYVGFKYVTVGDYTTGAISAHLVETAGYQPYLPANTGL